MEEEEGGIDLVVALTIAAERLLSESLLQARKARTSDSRGRLRRNTNVGESPTLQPACGRALRKWRSYAALVCGLVALFLRPALVFLLLIPAPLCRRGVAPVRRPELPPDIDSAP